MCDTRRRKFWFSSLPSPPSGMACVGAAGIGTRDGCVCAGIAGTMDAGPTSGIVKLGSANCLVASRGDITGAEAQTGGDVAGGLGPSSGERTFPFGVY